MKAFFKNFMFMTIISILVSSCIIDTKGTSGRTSRKSFGQFNNQKTIDPNALCTDSFDYTHDTCDLSCLIGTHVGTEKEVSQILIALKFDTTITEEVRTKLTDNIASSREICIAGNGFLRKSDLTFEPTFCACLAGKSHLIQNTCDFTCAQFAAADTSVTLHAAIKLGVESANHPELGDLFNWCNKLMTGSDNASPSCKLEARTDFGTSVIDMIITSNNKNFTANLTGQPYNKPIILTVKEQFSGAQSDSIQIYLKEPTVVSNYPQTPIKIMPISQYTCLRRSFFTTNTGSTVTNNYAYVVRNHFYFTSNNNPITIPPGNIQYVCHDQILGNNDNVLFPRFELIPNHLSLWDQSDSRFTASPLDATGNIPVINDLIKDKAVKLAAGLNGGVPSSVDIFVPLPLPSSPQVANNLRAGYFMIPFLDPISGDATCLTNTEYSDPLNPLYQAIGQFVGVDTEAFYIALREPIFFPAADGSAAAAPPDTLFINETLLKKIWFYSENGLFYIPNATTVKSKTINFYWPPDPLNPLIKKSTQHTYTIRTTTEINDIINGAQAPSGNAMPTTPSDKRIGCIPKSI